MDTTPARVPLASASSRLHYGRVMVAVAFLYSMFSSSAMGVPAVLILPMAKELGWSIGELSAPQGLRVALFGPWPRGSASAGAGVPR